VAGGVGRASHDGLRRRLVRGGFKVFSGKVVASILGLAINALLARLLSHDALGTYFLVFSTAMFGATISELGFERAVVRYVSASLATDAPGRARSAIWFAFGAGALGSLTVAGVLVVGLGKLLAERVYDSELMAGAVVFLAAWVIAIAMQTLVAEVFRGFQSFGLATLSDGLLANALAGAVFLVLWTLDTNLTLGAALVVSIGSAAAALLLTASLLRGRMATLGPRAGFDVGEAASTAWPLLVVSVAIFALGTGIDLWIVGAFADPEEVAIYGAATRLVFLVQTLNIVMNQVVPPVVAELHARGDRARLEASLRSAATVSSSAALVVVACLVFAGDRVLDVVFGSFFAQGATILAVLACARLFAVLCGPCGVALMMTGHQRIMMNLTLIAAALSVTAGVLLGWQFGALGVAVGTASAQVVQNLMQLFAARRRLGIWTHAQPSLNPFRGLHAST
jgi:O-antigen/teichoic acid export membrane protein